MAKGHFTHETESPWPLHFKHSHWWKRRSWSKFASHYAWGTNGVCECKMDVKSTWIHTWHQMDHVSWSLGLFSKLPLGGRPNKKPGDHIWHSERSNRWFILFNIREDPHEYTFIEITLNWEPGHIWLHTTLEGLRPHCLNNFGGVLGRPLDTIFWALTISWSWLLARVWSGPS
jgi:hypothetical protein